MATESAPQTNGTTINGHGDSSLTVKSGLAQMLKGGVIMDVVNAEQVRLCFNNLDYTPYCHILSRTSYVRELTPSI